MSPPTGLPSLAQTSRNIATDFASLTAVLKARRRGAVGRRQIEHCPPGASITGSERPLEIASRNECRTAGVPGMRAVADITSPAQWNDLGHSVVRHEAIREV